MSTLTNKERQTLDAFIALLHERTQV
jgi:hypothetical protein